MHEKCEQLGRIGVLMGGDSSERKISLKSGKAIYEALKKKGCQVFSCEICSSQKDEILSVIKRHDVNIVFIALHGGSGENGTVQGFLEEAGIPYTGTDQQASSLAMNKVATQSLLKEQGVVVPPNKICVKGERISLANILDELKGLPLVVKPSEEGSSIGVSIVYKEEELQEAVHLAFQYGDNILIEKYIEGREMTVGILGEEALPVVEIIPKSKFFDFLAKYEKGKTDYIVPANIPQQVAEKIQKTALEINRILGCRDFSRLDFILNGRNQPFFLEVNTIPGFTSTSLLPMAALQVGYSFDELCLRIIELAVKRSKLKKC